MSGMVGTWGHSGMRCRIKAGWSGAGREGDVFCYFLDRDDMMWVVVHWDDEEDPDLHKASGVEIRYMSEPWENVR